MATYGCIKEGFMLASGKNSTSKWKKTFVLLQNELIYYFGKKTETEKFKHTIILTSITKLERISEEECSKWKGSAKGEVSAFAIHTENGTFTLIAESAVEADSWLFSIERVENLRETFQILDVNFEKHKASLSLLDKYKHEMMGCMKNIPVNIQRSIGITKNLISQTKESETRERIEGINGALGETSIKFIDSALQLLDRPYAEEWREGLTHSGTYLIKFASGPYLMKFAASSPNKFALEHCLKLVVEDAQKILDREVPNPLAEIKAAIALVQDSTRYLIESHRPEERALRAQALGEQGKIFLSEIKAVLPAIEDPRLQASLRNLSSEVPAIVSNLLESAKAAASFSSALPKLEQDKTRLVTVLDQCLNVAIQFFEPKKAEPQATQRFLERTRSSLLLKRTTSTVGPFLESLPTYESLLQKIS